NLPQGVPRDPCPNAIGCGCRAGCRFRAEASTPRPRRPRVARPAAADSIAAMAPRGIHHLGVAVEDLDEALATYERLFGAELEYREVVPDQGVEAASLRVGASRVELLAAT